MSLCIAPSSTYVTPERRPPATEMATASDRFRWPLTSPVFTAAPARMIRFVTRRPCSGSSTIFWLSNDLADAGAAARRRAARRR